LRATIRGESTSIQRSASGSVMRYGRVSSPAPRFTTVRTPRAIASSTTSSTTTVRTTVIQANCAAPVIRSAMTAPFSPASRAASGSRKSASFRALSLAR
jgi:hypothetical protein